MSTTKQSVFRKGSTTYFYSSLLFEKDDWQKVATLYEFVRRVDDCVDVVGGQVDTDRLPQLYEEWRGVVGGGESRYRWVNDFHTLSEQVGFEHSWIEAFFHSMFLDLHNTPCHTLKDTQRYMYGSAEVIGLMMNRIVGIHGRTADMCAQLQGRAMQYINFLRDIDEDCGLGRQYIPIEILKKHGLSSLKKDVALRQSEAFYSLMRAEINRYQEWQVQAERGYRYLPFRARLAVSTAARLYNWTARVIQHDPSIVYRLKVKPRKRRVVMTMLQALYASKRVNV
ncbi:MAG: phytoene/squalene synthase family protein [Pseudomonadales bacterium]|nr:phytoene/squalene synthase family protein [Candidatus Woesebacteria bacterium]MCB9801949.1 phytoene/squalene synthase family protein [Pseudomonadales bacterium]